ncbi:MAG: alpha-galactosidase [Saprospiraceae bacterium]|nr:alpha-galactosidase [Lewinella sp.]
MWKSLPKEPKWETDKQTDWLLNATPYQAGVFQGPQNNEIVLSNGLIRRTFRLSPNAATVGFDNLITGASIIRGVKPEAEIQLNGKPYVIGGLKGQANYAFLRPEGLDTLKADPDAWYFTGLKIELPEAPFLWKQLRHHNGGDWPPPGIRLRMDYEGSEDFPGLIVSVYYELYDGLPVLTKWISLQNEGDFPVMLNTFSSEILAAVEYGSAVESREYNVPPPNIHVETDYAFASMDARDANHHVVHWEADPDYKTQVNYLLQTPCLLRVSPELGPAQLIQPDDTFTSFRTYILPYDSYDRERQGLSRRRMYRVIAPWTTENPLMMHARFADWERVKIAIDQAAEVGFEMVILTFGSGFNLEDDSEAYLAQMRSYADYARSKGVEIGGYSLLASRKIGDGQDVVMPEGQTPTFGNSPCLGSKWGQEYFEKLYNFYQKTGFTLLEHDGSYPGDVCTSTDHPGHRGYEDSRWTQYQTIAQFYQWCRAQGIYLNIPDYYYLTGGNKCAMGYREVNWSLPRDQQLLHTRQNIYDGTWTKLATMGWMFVPLTEYHGGGAAATIEPLGEHLTHYQNMIMSNLGAGVQACYRGPRLYDTEDTKNMVKTAVDWFKQHREVLEGDLIHLRRADGRDLDYWLMVNPGGKEKGALMVFNPLEENRSKTIKVPLYYTGLTDEVKVFRDEFQIDELELARDYNVDLDVEVDAGGFAVYFFE